MDYKSTNLLRIIRIIQTKKTDMSYLNNQYKYLQNKIALYSSENKSFVAFL